MRGLSKEGERYRIQFNSTATRPGQRYRERLPEGTTRRQAETYLSKLREDDRLGLLVWPSEREPAPEPPRKWRVGAFASEIYLPEYKAINSIAGWKIRREKLRMCAPWFWDLGLNEVTVEVVRAYRVDRLADGVRNRTVNMEWDAVRHLLQTAHEMGLCNPPPKIKSLSTKDRKPSRVLTEDEAALALQYAQQRGDMWYALTLLLLHTGARWGDVRRLRWEDVDLERGVVLYRAAKTDIERTVYLLPEVAAALRVLPRAHELVFVRKHRCEDRWIELSAKPTRLGKYRPWEGPELSCGAHTFRHTFATWRLERGGSIAHVSRWLGHSKISTTADLYYHTQAAGTPDDIADAPRPSVPRLRVVGDEK